MDDVRHPGRRYRDLRVPRSTHYLDERALGRAGVAWTAMALCLAIILSIAFGIGHEPKRLAANDQTLRTPTPLAVSAPILRKQ
jgi:hypothetical protein